MEFYTLFNHEMEKYKDSPIIVEGKKDRAALEALDFQRVFIIHEPGVPIRIRMEEISKQISKKDRLCILTDLDRKGRQLYVLLKQICQELGIKTDSSLRSLFLKVHVSHVEGVYEFLNKNPY